MNMQPVESSVISHVGHDPETNTMHVKFHSGQKYEYSGVTEEDHANFVESTSIGRHFNNHIAGKFQGRKL